ncbi:MAG: bifunctional diaminohydroxyphosphoribosylaminopyrimidine deaminase/5-amino-6-(5-phosphoribosylamino)uracil reductase RibD [Candidatus Kapabacteria bacterium]|nr:bifunctional diaminohydroxyphosphoribosylaminopyrimidine deaminase/5-amino-6-(5-phosphoribosylamino)uracil reductase RibD [Candidatus Kapabacteria bacterium]
MRRAQVLAQNGTGLVSPNPLVGTVIVKNGKIIAEGWHHAYGMPHAERDAISKCDGIDLTDAILYVNLEPCTHHGKQPPCTDAIIEKKFKTVVIASNDPNLNVSGDGSNVLRKSGIEVIEGVMKNEADWLNRFFFKHITSGFPYVILKAGQTADGFTALDSGESKWITNLESRTEAHKLRAQVDAVMVGFNTAEKDNPELTVRHVEGRNPWRIALDKNLKLDTNLKLFQTDEKHRTIICCSKEMSESEKAAKLQDLGNEILASDLENDGKMDLKDILEKLERQYRITSVLVEGGATLHSNFIEKGLADELQLFVAPKFFGHGISTFGQINIKGVEEAPTFNLKQVRQIGDDIHAIYIK